jgi:hypothetical protein
MRTGIANGIYTGINDGIEQGAYTGVDIGSANGVYNENILPNAIVKDGLVLYLDAAQNLSYVRSGTTWRDLTTNNNNGTLTNGPTFNSLNKGSIVFDGVNDFVNLGNILNYTSGNFTFNYWIYFNSFITTSTFPNQSPPIFYKGAFQENGYYVQLGSAGQVIFVTNQIGVRQATSSVALKINTWYNICHVRNGASIRTYINGIDSTISPDTHINPTSSSNNFVLAVYNNPVFLIYSNFRMPIFMNYNRAITAPEVLQNYIATKSRFDL